MSEIGKLRQRMVNVNRYVTEYRMTIEEAKILLKEIDELVASKEEPVKEAPKTTTVPSKIMDGGTF